MSQEIGDATAPRLGSPDVSGEIRQFAGRDALSTWQVFQAAVRQLAVRDYTVEQVSAWAPETVDLATWQKRRERALTLDPRPEPAQLRHAPRPLSGWQRA